MNSIKYLFVLLIFLAACKKDDAGPDNEKGKTYKNGILILNEGLFQHNNSSLSWLDLDKKEVKKEVFFSVNDRPLGDTGNDFHVYGGKIYIAVTGSSTLEVINKRKLTSIKQIKFDYNNQAQQPRQITSYQGNIFVSSFDGYVSMIDTSSLKITKRIKVGRNPEGVCVSNHSLFVANSGGIDANNPDSTVFKIDLIDQKVVDTFIVGKNPGAIISDNYNNIYVVKRGNYNETSEVVRINPTNHSVVNLGISATTMSKREDILYLSNHDLNTGNSKVTLYNCSSQNIVNSSFINNQDINTLYGVVPYQSNNIICLDAMNFTNSGYLRFFNASGQLYTSYNVGLNPNSIIIY